MNKFIIIIPFYNVEEWILNNLNSVLAQTYTNYEVYYVDDMSNDNSYDVLKKHAPANINIYKNTKKALALKNIYDAILRANPDDEDIIVTIDGDDWLARKDALEIIDKYYTGDTMLTYGSYIDYPSGRIPHNVIKYSDKVIQNSDYRKAPWRASALRTFKYKLWRRINVDDLKDSNGNFYEMAWDLAFMFPMLEMAGRRAKYVKEKIYWYNLTNPINDHKKDHSMQLRFDREVRSRKKYQYLQLDNVKLKEQFDFLKDRDLIESEVGFLSHRRKMFYDDKYFVVEKRHKDWTSSHLYGVPVKRQQSLKNNSVLSILKTTNCPYIPKVYGYSDDYVVFEFIDGRILDRKSEHLPSAGVEWTGLYEGNRRDITDSFLKEADLTDRKRWANQIKSAITHLHNIGVCHTDLTLFNIMIDKESNNIKLIDLLGCVPATDELIQLDWWCYKTFIEPELNL